MFRFLNGVFDALHKGQVEPHNVGFTWASFTYLYVIACIGYWMYQQVYQKDVPVTRAQKGNTTGLNKRRRTSYDVATNNNNRHGNTIKTTPDHDSKEHSHRLHDLKQFITHSHDQKPSSLSLHSQNMVSTPVSDPQSPTSVTSDWTEQSPGLVHYPSMSDDVYVVEVVTGTMKHSPDIRVKIQLHGENSEVTDLLPLKHSSTGATKHHHKLFHKGQMDRFFVFDKNVGTITKITVVVKTKGSVRTMMHKGWLLDKIFVTSGSTKTVFVCNQWFLKKEHQNMKNVEFEPTESVNLESTEMPTAWAELARRASKIQAEDDHSEDEIDELLAVRVKD